MHKATYALAGVVVTALVISPFAFATGEGSPIKGGARNPSPNASLSYHNETQIIVGSTGYGTRQSNKGTGGAAIYGCRAVTGGPPCLRASDLASGQAFQFQTAGPLGGTITAAGGDNAKPFTTNATGVATGLNADRVDGQNAADIATNAVTNARALTPFAQVAANGSLLVGKGVVSSAHGNTGGTGDGNYTVVFATDVSKCALVATESQIENAGSVGVEVGADGKTVAVRTRSGGNTLGTDPTPPTDKAFHIVAEC
jgi:hypothetical protein